MTAGNIWVNKEVGTNLETRTLMNNMTTLGKSRATPQTLMAALTPDTFLDWICSMENILSDM